MAERAGDFLEKKEDARVRYSKQSIKSAFYTLTQETSIDKITVTALCNRAGINRATFYKHYIDIYDLSEKLQEDALVMFQNKLDNADADDFEKIIIEILEYIKSRNEQSYSLRSFDSGNIFSYKVAKMIYRNYSSFLDKTITSNNSIDKPILFSYVAGGCHGIIDYWSENDYQDDAEDIAKMIISLTNMTVNSFI